MTTASPRQRLFAAMRWGQLAMAGADAQSAVQAYGLAIELLPVMVWHGLDQATREQHLRDLAGLSAEAATAAIAAEKPETAVELLESSRSVLWAQALHLRQDLAALRDRAPDLAAVLEASRAILMDSVASATDHHDDIGDARAAQRQFLERRLAAARDWDAAVAAVRAMDGFRNFLRPVSFTDVSAVAAAGPVVIVNISTFGSHALLLGPVTGAETTPAVGVLELPDATMGTVAEKTRTVLGAQQRAVDPTTDPATTRRDRQAVFDVLAWTWRAITEPVLRAVPKVANRRPGLPRPAEPAQVQAMDGFLRPPDRSRAPRPGDPDDSLARMGLRAGEVAGLGLDDIDWRLGQVTITGKGNRRDRLPLPATRARPPRGAGCGTAARPRPWTAACSPGSRRRTGA